MDRLSLIKYFWTLLVCIPLLVGAQTFPFTSGPIPLCDTSTFTAQVSGIGVLYPPNTSYNGAYTLDDIGINIVSDHPQTLQVSITAPNGTTLLLTAFNGAGGQNYTNTIFSYYGTTPITSGTAPFTGNNWIPQGGSMNIFDFINADGTWTVTVIDTSCVNGGTGPNGTWTPGTFNGGGSGGFQMSFSTYYNPCGWYYNYYTSTEYLCPGDSILLQASNINNPWWSSGPGNFNTTGYASVSGTYTFSGYDWFGCTVNEAIDIIIVPPPNLGADTTLYHCSTGATYDTWYDYYNSLNLTGPTSTYMNGSAVYYSTLSNLSSGDILTVVTMRNTDCADTAEVEFIFVDPPAQGNDTSIAVCGGSAVDLTLLPDTIGVNPLWTMGGSAFTTPQSASQSGNYTLISESAAGCSDTMNITLSVDSALYGPDQTLSVCSDSIVDLTGIYPAVGGAQWYYQGAQIPNVSSIANAGNYTVIANSSGCIDSATVSVLHLNTPQLGPDTSMTICSSEQVDLNTLYQSPSATLAWTNASGTAVVNPIITQSGVYSLVASAASGCIDDAIANITVLPAPILAPDTVVDICDGSLLDLTQLNASPGNSVQWAQGGTPLTVTTGNFNGQYTITATTSSGCMDSAFATVNVNPTPNLGPDTSMMICSSEQVDLTALYQSPIATLAWTDASGSAVANPIITQSGVFTVMATTANGCSDNANANINVLPIPVLAPDTVLAICDGSLLDLTQLNASPGNSVQWAQAGMPLSNTTGNFNGQYTITATTPSGCMDSAFAVVNVNPSPNLGTDQALTICSTDSADLSPVFSTQGLSTVWILNGTVVNDVSALNTAGDYLLIGTNNFSCADSAIVELIVNTAPDLGPDQFYTLCPWQTVDLTNVFPISGLAASYSSNGIGLSDPTMVHAQDTFLVAVVDMNGCADQAWVVIDTVDCLCEADFTHDAYCFQEGVSFEVLADSSIVDAYWQFSSDYPDAQGINPQVWFHNEGVITATLIANLSCGQVIVEQEFELGDCSEDCDFWTPNSFTPNGDGINDMWRPVSQCVPLEMSTTIFNRFGNTIYSSNAPTAAWGGDNDPIGVYVYEIQYRLPYQERKLVRGVVNLVR